MKDRKKRESEKHIDMNWATITHINIQYIYSDFNASCLSTMKVLAPVFYNICIHEAFIRT